MLRVGLTGGLGSGKSTVAGYLRGLGAYVIEADELGRALTAASTVGASLNWPSKAADCRS
jgi:dephospho-CoA kinase